MSKRKKEYSSSNRQSRSIAVHGTGRHNALGHLLGDKRKEGRDTFMI